MNLKKQYSRVNCWAFSFANGSIVAWNSLSDDIVICASSICAFKKRLNSFDQEMFVCHVGPMCGASCQFYLTSSDCISS